jgi:DNA repair exonuclease SbcCD ATPase subunit
MGKLLRGLVYVILILSVVALVFANLLFGKREVLTKRTSVLEDQIVKLAKTIEAADAADAAAPEVKKDVSEVSDRAIDNPDRESVLEGYPIKLEQPNLPTLDFGSTDKRLQLRNYFALGPDGEPIIDQLDKKPATKGPGSMQELLDQIFDRAKAQQASLNKTRSELTKMREKATTFVEEVNKLKADGRTTKGELKTAREQVATLTGEKEALEGRVTKLTAEKKELSAEVADAKNQVERLNEEKLTVTEDLAKVREAYEELKKKYAGKTSTAGQPQDNGTTVSSLSAGDKGTIIAANDELKFVIINFSDDAVAEMLGPERQNAMPQLEMNVRRTGRQSAAGEFVTRIKLRQIVRGKNLVVADILSDWQQTPVEKGDVVFF